MHGTARLGKLLPSPLRVNVGLLIALAAVAGVSWLLTRSRLGFTLRAVGASPTAARTAGMNVGRTYVIAMLIAGGLAGLAGCVQILGGGTNYALTNAVDAGLGFDGITVALLGRAKPWPTVWAGLLFGALHAGSATMQSRTGTSIDLVTIVQALVVLFIAAPAFVRAVFRLRSSVRLRRCRAREGVERVSVDTTGSLEIATPEIVEVPASRRATGRVGLGAHRGRRALRGGVRPRFQGGPQCHGSGCRRPVPKSRCRTSSCPRGSLPSWSGSPSWQPGSGASPGTSRGAR